MQPDLASELRALLSTVAPARTERGPFWRPELTPLFPTRWPATKGTSVLRYAYASGHSLGLRDGQHTAAPWAILHIEGEQRELTPVGPFIELGIQAVRRLHDEEAAQPRPGEVEDELRALLIAGLPPIPPQRVRVAYQSWRKHNGVIASFVVPLQASFFGWLE